MTSLYINIFRVLFCPLISSFTVGSSAVEIYKSLIKPVLNVLGSETMHVAAREILGIAEMVPGGLQLVERCADRGRRFYDERLKVTVGEGSLGFELDNPCIVGAGWDKPAHAIMGLHRLGFGGVEAGTVTPVWQYGNPKPRQFVTIREERDIALNRLGFNGSGMSAVMLNLMRYQRRLARCGDARIRVVPVGGSVGMNKDTPGRCAPMAHAIVIMVLYGLVFWFTINVSSPNTPGLRKYQQKELLTDIVQLANETMDELGGRKPLFVKVAPDLSRAELDDVVRVVVDNKLAGMVIGNTTVNKEIKVKYGWGDQSGGLSGDDEDFRKMSTEMIRHVWRETRDAFMIHGAGGVNSVETALEKIEAGASALHIVTGIRQVGPTLPGKINRGIVAYLEKRGVKCIQDLVGVAA